MLILNDLGEPLHSGTLNGILMPGLDEHLCKNNLRQIVKNPMFKVTRKGPANILFGLKLYSTSF